MSQEDFVIHTFCMIDDQFKAMGLPRLRRRGKPPLLHDTEALAVVCAGEMLGLHSDKRLFVASRERFGHLLPSGRTIPNFFNKHLS